MSTHARTHAHTSTPVFLHGALAIAAGLRLVSFKIKPWRQAFLVAPEVGISEWLTGRLELPPGAIKDSEHVALSTQIYVVAEGQPDALEIAIAMPSKKVQYTGRGKEDLRHVCSSLVCAVAVVALLY